MTEQIAAQRPDHQSDFDPFGMALRTDPFAMLPELIANSPGFMMAEGTPSAYVASHRDVTAVTRDFRRFSSVKPAGLPGMERFDMFNGQPVMNYSDPPEHTRRRKVVNAAFTPRRLEHLHEVARSTIERLLDAAGAKEKIDIYSEVCRPLSTELLLGVHMGVDPREWHLFFATIQGMGLLDQLSPGEAKPQAYLDAWAAGAGYCNSAIEEARATGAENLVGLIAAAANEGGSIDQDEMMGMMMVLLTGGLGTVASAATAAIYGMLQQQGLPERLRQVPTLAGNVLEEAIRMHPPVTLSMRFAKEDTEIGGQVIPAGTPVYVLWTAANHDPDVFPDPYRFDVDRPNLKDHVGFGFGIHTCIGNAITRSVVPMLLNELVQRFPDCTIADASIPPRFSTGSARGRHMDELWVKLRG